MARPVSRSKAVKEDYSFLRRLYAVLPWVLLSVVGLNLWFVFSYVRRERVVVDGVRDRVLGSVSNALCFVQTSLSNEIVSARSVISNDLQVMRSRMLALSTPLHRAPTNGVPGSSSSVAVIPSAPDLLPVGEVPATYFVGSGSPMLDLSGSYYSVGDDFGLGPIESISKMFVVCGGRKYRLSIARPMSAFASFNRSHLKKEESLDD